jgi:hypothetical protein
MWVWFHHSYDLNLGPPPLYTGARHSVGPQAIRSHKFDNPPVRGIHGIGAETSWTLLVDLLSVRCRDGPGGIHLRPMPEISRA